jgi:streptomycin 6-kinase
MTTPETQVPLTLAEFAARPCAYNRDYVVVSILREGGERAQFRLSRGGAASLADELRGSIRTRPTVSEGDVERVARAIDPVLHEHAMAVISGKGDPDFTTRIARAAIAALSQPAPTIQPSAEGLAGELEALAKFAVPAPWQANLAPSRKVLLVRRVSKRDAATFAKRVPGEAV